MADEKVVTEQPTRIQPPGQWSTGMINASCCIGKWFIIERKQIKITAQISIVHPMSHLGLGIQQCGPRRPARSLRLPGLLLRVLLLPVRNAHVDDQDAVIRQNAPWHCGEF